MHIVYNFIFKRNKVNIYLDPKRLNCLKAILAILKTAQDAAANTGKRTIRSRTSMKQSYDYIFLKYYS